jgi:signal transduction histidine kinase
VSTDAEHDRLVLLVHELRSPVAALTAISDALADGSVEGSSVRELARLAILACRSATRIVEEAAVGPLERTEVDVAAMVRDAVTAAVLEGGHVRADLEPAPLRISADEVRLRQALDKLLRNAAVHSGSDDVVVGVHREGQRLLITVSDDGRGIPRADQARIFERGERLDASAPGSGVGLAIARSIVEAHGGTLELESASGSGATFTIVLPLADGEGMVG